MTTPTPRERAERFVKLVLSPFMPDEQRAVEIINSLEQVLIDIEISERRKYEDQPKKARKP